MTHYNSFATNLVREGTFPPDWEGELPPVMTREQLKEQMGPSFRERGGFSDQQIEEVIDFFEKYERRYHEVPGGKMYHRPCGGGAVKQGMAGVACSRCGTLPDLIPPELLRR